MNLIFADEGSLNTKIHVWESLLRKGGDSHSFQHHNIGETRRMFDITWMHAGREN